MPATYAPRSRAYLALPIHTMAGVTPRLGLDPFSAIASIAGPIIGGIFGGDAQSRELKNQRKIAEMQLNAATASSQMQKDLGLAQIDAAVSTERIRAQNELAAINAAYSANLASQRVKKQVASEALSAQLLSQTQSGIFGLAQSGLEQSASLSRTYPRNATFLIVALVVGTALAVTWMKQGTPRGRKRSRKGNWKAGRFEGNWDNHAGSAISTPALAGGAS